MKTFCNYLAESVKTYTMRIKFGGLDEAPDADCVEKACERFGVTSMTRFKKTPIQAHPQDFPQLRFADVWMADAEFDYPVTPDELYAHLTECTPYTGSQIVVINANHPEEVAREATEAAGEEEYVALLDSDYEVEDLEPTYGDEFVKNFLQELETRDYDFVAEKTPRAKTTNDLPVHTDAVLKDAGNSELGKR